MSCSEKAEDPIIAAIKPAKARFDFGFKLNDFNVANDTVAAGDTFGGILERQNIGDKRVYDIVQKIKDSFDVRSIRRGKPYTMLRSLDRRSELQVFIYQPDRLNYYIIDLRDSITVTKKTKPVTIKKRTIAGQLDGSLSEALEKENVEPELASKISKIYAWSIDFFKLKKGDKFGVTFTERYINDTVYDGVDSLQAAFLNTRGKLFMLFRLHRIPNRENSIIMMKRASRSRIFS